jgi:hypothetical protein
MLARVAKVYMATQAALALVLLYMGIKGGRELANAHPDVRGGGDIGFGGSADVLGRPLTEEELKDIVS